MESGVYQKKKKFKGFPMYLHLKNFKTGLMSGIKQWSSRHQHLRHRYRRCLGCSGSKVEIKMNDVKGNC
jgi:hypothetical protein